MAHSRPQGGPHGGPHGAGASERRKAGLLFFHLARIARLAERGEESVVEFTVASVPIMIMVLLIAFVTVVRSAQMPVWTAAGECARAAVATMDESLGREQAERAARDSLAGNSISATSIQVDIVGVWRPESTVTCQVTYDIDVSGIAGFAELTGGRVPMSAEVTLRIEPHKSRWG